MVSTCFLINLTMLMMLTLMCLSVDFLASLVLLLECVTLSLIIMFSTCCIVLNSSAVFVWVFLLIVLGTVEFVLLTVLMIFLNKFTKIK